MKSTSYRLLASIIRSSQHRCRYDYGRIALSF